MTDLEEIFKNSTFVQKKTLAGLLKKEEERMKKSEGCKKQISCWECDGVVGEKAILYGM